MAIRRRGGAGGELNAWPGYVDALSTLLMVIIFVLLVFVLAQAFLSVALSGRDQALDRLNRQMAELSDMLSLERGRTAELRGSITQLSRELATASSTRDNLAQQLASLRGDQAKLVQDRDGLQADRDKLAARLADSDLQAQSAQSRNVQLQAQLADAAKRADAAGQDAAAQAVGLIEARRQLLAAQADLAATRKQVAAREQDVTASQADLAAARQQIAAREKDLAARQADLAAARGQVAAREQDVATTQADLLAARRDLDAARARIAEMQRQAEAMDRTVQADKATIEAKLSDLARMTEQSRALAALRDDLERQVRDAAARTVTDEQARAAVAAQLAEEKKFSDSARAQVALLNHNIEQMRAQLAQVSAALDVSEKSGKDKDAQIVNLGSRLNAALAQKVEELQRYRSDFFGKLREVLANRPGIQVVGDRFVFQSEVLFPLGSADLTVDGWDQVKALGATLISVSNEIPPDVNWLLRVDGHADRQPVQSSRFPSNWELSSARAITVVKLLIAVGVPANRLAATGFGDNQPIDPGTTPEAYAKNRRIEIRLTDR